MQYGILVYACCTFSSLFVGHQLQKKILKMISFLETPRSKKWFVHWWEKFVFELKIFELLIFGLKSLNVLHAEKYLNDMFQLERSGMSKTERNSILHSAFFDKFAENPKSFTRRGDYYKHEAGLQNLPWVKIFIHNCERWACSKKCFLMITGEWKLLLNLLIFCWSLSTYRRKVGGLKPILVVPQFLFAVLKTKHLLLILSEVDHSVSLLGNREENLAIQC